MYYLLTLFDAGEYLHTIPEVTLWKNIDEAIFAALSEASHQEIELNFKDAEVDYEDKMISIPEFCEILPITVSNQNQVTWFGKPWENKETYPYKGYSTTAGAILQSYEGDK